MDANEFKPQGDSEWLKEFGLALEDRVDCDRCHENPAMVWTVVKCCNSALLLCNDCKENIYHGLVQKVSDNETVECSWCHKQNNPRGWMKRFQPLALDTPV